MSLSGGYSPSPHASVTHYDIDVASTPSLLLKGFNILPTHHIPRQRTYSPRGDTDARTYVKQFLCPYSLVLKVGKNLVPPREVLPCTYPTLHSIPPLHVPRSPLFWITPGYCWSTSKCQKLCLTYAVVAGPGVGKSRPSDSRGVAWKYDDQQYPGD